VAHACSDNEARSRTSAILRRVAAYTGVTLATVGLVTAFAGTHADAADIDYTSASAAEIEDHLTDLETQRDAAAADLQGLQAQLDAAKAVIEAAAAEYGTSNAQLTVVTAAVESADDDLDAKVSSLVAYAQEQTDKYEEAQDASASAKELTADIKTEQQEIADLDKQIGKAEKARDAAEAEEAEAAAAAAAEAEAEASSEATSSADSGSDSDSTASYSADAATAAVQFAKDQLGESYVFGAAGPDTWDCSGLISGAYGVSGISLTHSTWTMWDETSGIDQSDLKPGDLIFYNGQNHVAMYIGGGEVIHAPKPGDVVKITKLEYMGMSVDGYRRV
jgi:cell wall-associated NlpC family hydrolase